MTQSAALQGEKKHILQKECIHFRQSYYHTVESKWVCLRAENRNGSIAPHSIRGSINSLDPEISQTKRPKKVETYSILYV